MDQEINNILEEKHYFLQVIKTLECYTSNLLRYNSNYSTKQGEDFKKDRLNQSVVSNSDFLLKITNFANLMFNSLYSNIVLSKSENNINLLQDGNHKIQIIFENLARDWSSLGQNERKQCYEPIIEEIISIYPENQCSNRNEIKILVPGAGLGRLPYEIASKGFQCQGNEFNLFMLIVSNFILNQCKNIDEYNVYPWAFNRRTNIKSRFINIKFPDVNPTLSSEKDNFTMVAGDFLEVYSIIEWNCIVTCFFIDCSPDPLLFIRKIYNILIPGGRWINFGPLAYNSADVIDKKYRNSEMLCEIIQNVGFEVEKFENDIKSQYCQDPGNSMPERNYNSVLFVCRKKLC